MTFISKDAAAVKVVTEKPNTWIEDIVRDSVWAAELLVRKPETRKMCTEILLE